MSVENSQLQCLNNIIYHDFVNLLNFFFYLAKRFFMDKGDGWNGEWLSKVERQTTKSLAVNGT